MILNEVITIPLEKVTLEGNLQVPENASGLVVFVHGSGSSRFSPRNNHVAKAMNQAGLSTLLFDLLTAEEDRIDQRTREFRFNIPLLASRLIQVTDWITYQPSLKNINLGYFGASTGAAAALIAAAQRSYLVKAIVSRGGRPDLAGSDLALVKAPVLFLVGSLDVEVISLNRQAQQQLHHLNELKIISGATHLFEEPGTLDQVTKLATQWFKLYLQ